MSFIQIQRNSDGKGGVSAYAHWATSRWLPGKRHPKQERVYLGRLADNEASVELSKRFAGDARIKVPLAEIERAANGGEDVPAWLASMATPPGADSVKAVETVGQAYALRSISSEIGLEKALREAFGAEMGRALAALAAYQAAEGRPLYLASHWMEDAAISVEGFDFSSPAISGLMAAAGADKRGAERFSRLWLDACGRPKSLVCDITSISTYSGSLDMAEFGHNRDEERLPQINLALVAARTSGLPLAWRVMPGSVPDVATLDNTATFLEELGLEGFAFSLDRGFYSMANLRKMLQKKIGFVIGAPFSVKAAGSLVLRHRSALASSKRSFQRQGKVLRHIADEWLVDDGRRGRKRKIAAHLFHDPSGRARRLDDLERRVFALEAAAGKELFETGSDARRWLAENAKGLAKCFSVRRKGDGAMVARRPSTVARMATRFGYTVVLASDRKAGRDTVLDDFGSRDAAEKLFDLLKNEDGQSRLRSGNDDVVEGRLLLAFCALALRSSVEARMRESGLLRKMSVPDALCELKKIKVCKTSTGRRVMMEITKRQRDVLKALRLQPPT